MSFRTLTKVLAGVPDLLLGRGTVSQTRNGTAYNIERLAVLKPVTSMAALRAVATVDEDAKYFEALVHTGGNGTFFYFDAASMSVDDGATILKPDDILAANPGRWLKLTIL